MSYTLPDHLLQMLVTRRAIPFIGSGFSAASAKLPDWTTLLERVWKRTGDPQDFQEVRKQCADDPLQIAEYIFLKTGKNIGPIRHWLSHELQPSDPGTLSGPHVELANLHAPQIYTTNYDELIEQTFERLGLKHSLVSLPRDVANSHSQGTQIVKYHGDLRYEHTLVLTESSYYDRLDFESPMDLKFRSDLLGRTVLFVGYSFRDINIRIIWFKLMKMMRDVPANDRQTSYIVRLHPNAALEALYREVGIQTIVLDPSEKAASASAQAEVLGEFMVNLARAAASSRPEPASSPGFVSSSLLDVVRRQLRERTAHRPGIMFGRSGVSDKLMELVSYLSSLTIPDTLATDLDRLVEEFSSAGLDPVTISLTTKLIVQFGATSIRSSSLLRALTFGIPDPRAIRPVWKSLWSGSLNDKHAEWFVDAPLRRRNALYMEVLYRIADGTLLTAANRKLQNRAKNCLKKAKGEQRLKASARGAPILPKSDFADLSQGFTFRTLRMIRRHPVRL
jgi:hypothetical protein